MSNMLNGGDEIGALVFDLGHYSLRVGYAQEVTPKAEIPTVMGIGEDGNCNASKVEPMNIDDKKPDNNIIQSTPKYYIDTTNLHVPRKGMEVVTYMKDGMIEDWDHFEKVLDYTYSKVIQSETEYHPVLFSESPWNIRNKREKLTELMFEKYNVPAYFLVKNAVLAAYANGRATGVIVDSGLTHTSAIPVQDGYVLKQAIVTTPLGGDYISMQCQQFLQENDVDLSPAYMIESKEVVKDHDKPRWVKKKNLPEVRNSWHNYMVKKLIQDFQATTLQVFETPYDEKIVSNIPASPYEFPTGYRKNFGSERFRIPEALFDPSMVQMRGGMVGNTMLGVGHIVTTSVGMCDIDVRPALYGSVIVTGGNSFIHGFPERLNRDLLMRISSSIKLKLISANECAERRFGAWIGGSILASNGTFQKMWISSQDYQESGKSLVEKKCL